MASLFTKIINGEIPSYKCAENDKFYAFLDINPVQKGHTLVVPKKEEDYIFDISDDELGEMMVFAKQVAKAIQTTIPCLKVGVAVIGLEVRHAHIHLIPMQTEGDFNFKKHQEVAAEEMKEIAAQILANYNSQK